MIISVIQVGVLVAAVILVLYYIKQISRTALLFIALLFILIGIATLAPYITTAASVHNTEYITSIVSIFVLAGVLYAIRTSHECQISKEHLQSLRDIELSMLSGLTHKGVLSTMLQRLTDTLGIDAAAIILTDSYGNNASSVISCQLDKEFQRYLTGRTDDFTLSIIENRTPMIIPSIKPHEEDDFLTNVRNQGFHSYLGTPVVRKGGMPVGILTLFNRTPRHYAQREVALIRTVSGQMGIALDRAQLIDRIQEMNFESVRALVSAIESRDPYTRGHSIQVAELSVVIAREMEFSPREITLLEFAGLLHDVGKIAIPQAILQKKSCLTEEEWQEIHRHSIISAKIIEPISNLKPIQSWVLCHHERFDGNGYPNRVKGKAIPLASRIMAVCDTYSAMTGDRPYRKALHHEDAFEELRTVAGTQLDPSVVEIFTHIYAESTEGC